MSASTYATLGASAAQYNMRSALWPAEWNAVGAGGDIAAAAAQSSSAMSQCRQPSSGIIQSGREPYADMLGVHGSAQSSAEFGDLASMFTGFIE